MIPPRITEIINTIATRHEVDKTDILGKTSTRAVEIARAECYRTALAEPKPNGLLPTKAEVARWFGRGRGAVSAKTREPA